MCTRKTSTKAVPACWTLCQEEVEACPHLREAQRALDILDLLMCLPCAMQVNPLRSSSFQRSCRTSSLSS